MAAFFVRKKRKNGMHLLKNERFGSFLQGVFLLR